MRSISGLYFGMAFTALIIVVLFHVVSKYIYVGQWCTIGIVLFITTLIVIIAKPYRKPWMNYMDILLLSNYVILCYMLSSAVGHHTQLVSRMLIAAPIAVLIVVTILQKIHAHKIFHYFRLARKSSTVSHSAQCSAVNTPTSTRPLIQPTSNVMNYGTNTKEN